VLLQRIPALIELDREVGRDHRLGNVERRLGTNGGRRKAEMCCELIDSSEAHLSRTFDRRSEVSLTGKADAPS